MNPCSSAPRRCASISLPAAAALVGAALLASTTSLRAKDRVRAGRGTITLPTYPWAAVNHPYFRGTDGVNIYPYPMLDFLSREKTNRTYGTVVLENEFLRLTFLPELGGKVHEVIDKTMGQPMFYVNHVIKPGLIGQCGAWTSGGIEWNTGPQGHTVGCMQPVEVVILPEAKDGSRSVAVGETERIYGTRWTVVVTLRPDRSFIEERIRIYNPTETIRPYYFWNCTAVPNTKGFRFIYPMTLGTDHGAERFFRWPIHEGKDLSCGTNYQDASSIFAWHCDQDFFGSYNDDLGRGVVAYANHHQLPGKKAWTWGWGSYGTMHQMDLTDDDGPYNEVQTGPLLTQGEVGRLDPCEAVEWQEWWYPIRGIGGFTFANQNVAVNATHEDGRLRLRMLGSGSWRGVEAKVRKDQRQLASRRYDLPASQPVELTLEVAGEPEPFEIELGTPKQILARFRFPLDLPVRQPPEKNAAPRTAAEFAQAGWQEYLFARFTEAEAKFRLALDQDPRHIDAHTGLAYLHLDPDPAAATRAARAALEVDPHCGRAHLALAVAEDRLGNAAVALEEAWQAALDPATAVAGRALVAKLLIRRRDWLGVVNALSETGPWVSDPLCRNRLASAHLHGGRELEAKQLAEANLRSDPLDGFARRMRVSATRTTRLQPGSIPEAEPGVQLPHRLPQVTDETGEPSPGASRPPADSWPYRYEDLEVLRRMAAENPGSGSVTLSLGHLLFHLGRHTEGRELWKRAVELGASPVIAYRALGMASLTLDKDAEAARHYLTLAHQADPSDAIVARDLARVLFTLADKAEAAEGKRELRLRARDTLRAAYDQGCGRSDFVALLARAQNRLDHYAETARLLDSVRVTIWEGAREAHDLFEEAHLKLGEGHLAAGRATEALAEFNRALEYPANLATGRPEGTREAHIHYLRGNALAALGRQTEARAAWQLAAEEPESTDPARKVARQLAREALQR